ncbi:hypothetical protein Val02_78800 [Virgisporangium aliadipatigenens]|uniref:Uncharacterized protein n=1 Tax=Virgisporangium aliadipatigenens TaxID=741659 RepID=A0A8J4DUN5_9ACTN|nr:hypothetical protein [Virgisporangium aliadipatigenens]GIJ50994.1 hypothetical protein Val02_78800 [Virgisporangium aliadipatigenens]
MRILRIAKRVLGFDARGLASMGLWVLRRRHGVPPGATAVSYSGAQTALQVAFLGASVFELVVVEVLLRALDAPAGLRGALLPLGVYGVLIALAVIASCVTRPHVITDDAVRLRYGAFFDAHVPRSLVVGLRAATRRDERGAVRVDGDTLVLAVTAQTNLVLDLAAPVTITRPLGLTHEVRTIRFFADEPALALAAFAEENPTAFGAFGR